MINLTLRPPRAQLVGLGYTLPSGQTLGPSTGIPPVLQDQIRKAAVVNSGAGGSTATAGQPCTCADGSSGSTNTSGACVCAPPATNWALYGGIGVGVLLLGLLLLRR